MSWVGGPGNFKKEWYHKIPAIWDGIDTPRIKKIYYIRVKTQQGCLYVNDNYELAELSEARVFSEEEELVARSLAQSLNKSGDPYTYEVFGVSATQDE